MFSFSLIIKHYRFDEPASVSGKRLAFKTRPSKITIFTNQAIVW